MRISDWSSDVCSSDLRAVGLDIAGWGNVVGGHRVAEQSQDFCTFDIVDGRWRPTDVLEERRVLDVGPVRLPDVRRCLRQPDSLPMLITGRHAGVFLVAHARVELALPLSDLPAAGPGTPQVHRLAAAGGDPRFP